MTRIIDKKTRKMAKNYKKTFAILTLCDIIILKFVHIIKIQKMFYYTVFIFR